MALLIAAIFFALFLTNVIAGALFGGAFVGDVSEMLLMAVAVIAFVFTILKRERDAGGEASRQD